MPTIENCMHCGKLCNDGCCPCQWPISMERIACTNCTTLTAERDRLAAENAELRKEHDAMWTRVDRHRDEIDVPSLCAEVDDLILGLAAANATLDALREAVPVGALCYCYECEAFVVGGEIRRSYNKRCPKCGTEDLVAFAHELQDILYPQPTETTDDAT